jgi:prophage antirepressor-like protein
LGYKSVKTMRIAYNNRADEFSENEAREILLPTAGGPQMVLCFSEIGVRLLALIAGTPTAIAFRKWLRGQIARGQAGRAWRQDSPELLAAANRYAAALERMEPMRAELAAAAQSGIDAGFSRREVADAAKQLRRERLREAKLAALRGPVLPFDLE